MEEELTLHEEEGEVVQGPAENGAANLVVEALDGGVGVVVAAALPAENGDSLEEDPDGDGGGDGPPDNGVAEQVDLSVIAAPEVDAAAENGPRLGARVPGVGVGQTSVCLPHDLVKLDKLANETGLAVVDLFGIVAKLGVLVMLNVPETVGKTTALGAGDFLLLRGPVGELDLVGEEDTASHEMDKTELGLNGTEALLGGGAVREGLLNLDLEVVIGVAVEALITVGRDFVLPFSLAHWGADIVGVEAAEGGSMEKTKNGAVGDVLGLGKVVPGLGSVDGLAVASEGLGLVLEQPDVVLVLVGVEGDLLLLGSGRVHEGVRVEVAALGVDVADGDTAAEENIGGDVAHTLVVESRLELGAHEAVTVTGVDEANEVDGEHGEVEGGGNDDEAEDASEKVLGEGWDADVFGITEQDPELDEGQGANPGNGEETNPLDAAGNTETEAGHGEPEPPGEAEGLGWAELMLVGEAVEGEGSEGGGGDEGGIEEDETSLGEETVFYTKGS